jgi:hypothetical protein
MLYLLVHLSSLIFDLTRDFENEVDGGTVDNFSASESESEESDDNEDARAGDSEATAGAVDSMGVSSGSGIRQVDEAVAEAPEDDEELDVNDGMSQFYC